MERVATITVEESSQPSQARRAAVRMAEALQFTEAAQGNLAIVVTEAATNLVKHAGGGQIVLRAHLPSHCIEVLALDKGPGIHNLAECLRDGYTTAGSPGTGLGAISRLSSRFDIFSGRAGGTILRAVCASGRENPQPAPATDVGIIVSAKPGEEVSGDNIAVRETESGFQVMVADGLGHGLLAARASEAAAAAFHAATGSPRQLVESIHAALHSTRGAAIAVADIQFQRGTVLFCGLGNISAVLVQGDRNQHLVSFNGIAGHQAQRVRELEYGWSRDAALVLHSDGLSARWKLSDYPGITARQSSIIAAALFRDHRRMSDDASVVVARQTADHSCGK